MAKKHDNTKLPKLAKVSAFFSAPVAIDDAGVSHYPIDQLVPNQRQPRKYFDPEPMQQLVESIKRCGVLEPLLVTSETNGRRAILAGERRWRAARAAGLASVPVYELDLEPEVAAQVPLIENLLRRDLNPFEELEGYLLLLHQQLTACAAFKTYSEGVDSREAVTRLLFAMRNALAGRRAAVAVELVNSVNEVFRAIGNTSWQSFVAHRLSLRKLPAEVQSALREGWLDYTKAIAIGRLSDERFSSPELAAQARVKLLQAARADNLALREVKARVQALLASLATANKQTKQTKQIKRANRNLVNIQKRARQLFSRISKSYRALNARKQQRLNTLLTQLESVLGEQ